MPLEHWLTIQLKKVFIGKEKKKKTINVLTVFFISHKSDVTTFLKGIRTRHTFPLKELGLDVVFFNSQVFFFMSFVLFAMYSSDLGALISSFNKK